MRDVKIICSECGDRMFLHTMPSGADELKCPNCNRWIEVNFFKKKEWYGGYDGKENIYDCIYCDNYSDYNQAKKDIGAILGEEVLFGDASDPIHEYRFSVEIRENRIEYYRKIIDSGWAMKSLIFGLFMRMNADKALELVQEWKQNG